jgi:serine protease inhibitor
MAAEAKVLMSLVVSTPPSPCHKISQLNKSTKTKYTGEMTRLAHLLRTSALLVVEVSLLFSGAVQAASSPLMEQQRLFADELVSKLYQNPNECTSALGISMAFSLIYPSATGTSLTEMQDILGFPSSETNLQLLWNATQSDLQAQHDGECFSYEYPDNVVCEDAAPTVQIGNSVWVPMATTTATTTDGPTSLDAEYAQVLGDYVFPIDFSDAGAGALVNDWVNASTNGLIDSIVEDGPLDEQFNLLAVNSIYLKAQWYSPFESFYTNEDVFYTSAERTQATDSKARFMHKVDFIDYSNTAIPGYHLLKLDFHRGDGLSMVFALPGSTTTASNSTATALARSTATSTSNMVKSQDVWSALDSLQLQRVALALPMFKFESMYEGSLMSTLKDMGMNAPFMGELCIYDNSCQEMISMIIQKTVINVFETGVEAAAVTAIATVTSAPPEDLAPVLVMMDHPFQFFILDTQAHVVLFEGQVGNPGISEDAAAAAPNAQLEAWHAEGDFWMANFNVEPKEAEFSSSSAPNGGDGDDDTPDTNVDEGGDDTSGTNNDNSTSSNAIRQYSTSGSNLILIMSMIALGLGSGWTLAL